MWDDFLRQLKQLPPAGWNVLLASVAILTGFLFKGIATLALHLYSKTKPQLFSVPNNIKQVKQTSYLVFTIGYFKPCTSVNGA